jgi:hypothetical protein
MSLKCPICESTSVDAAKSQRSIAAPLGPSISFEVETDTCASCGEVGDFGKHNDGAIRAAEQTSATASIGHLLNSLSQSGCSMAYMERALLLPPRTIARWKAGEYSAAGIVLLRMLATYPWLIEVADAKYSPRFASGKVVTEAGKILGGFVQSLVLGPEVTATRSLYETTNVGISFDTVSEHAENSAVLNHALEIGCS